MIGVNFLKHIYKVLKEEGHKIITSYQLYYIIEDCNWAIMEEAKGVTSKLNNIKYLLCSTSSFIKNSIIHYGSVNCFYNNKNNWKRNKKNNNKVIVTWFHVVQDDPRISEIVMADEYVDCWHTSCLSTKNEMIKCGIDSNKIIIIPIGIDLELFKKTNEQERKKSREKLGISENHIAIGSFQKDGNGWGDGIEPKLIKGPDIFCDVLDSLKENYSLFVVLTGPARGYVKKRLEISGIPFSHTFLDKIVDVAEYYKALDLYIVGSRVEGGPKSVLESMATGVPIVSTKVGMAPEIIQHGINGMIAEVENVDQLVRLSDQILKNPQLKMQCIENAYETIERYDYSRISIEYKNLLYKIEESV